MGREAHRRRGWSGGAVVRRAVAAAGLLAMLVCPAAASDGFVATIDRLWIRGDSLKVDFTLEGLFSDHMRSGLSRGLPMTFRFEIQLWRDRSGWWDALESHVAREYKVQRNVWDDHFFVDRGDGTRLWLSDLDALEGHLSHRTGEFVTSIEETEPGRAYYVAVIPSLRPLTIDDIREVEAWLTGEIEKGRERTGFSMLKSLPGLVAGVFIDLAGLGDKSTVARSGRFSFPAPGQNATGTTDGGDRPDGGRP